MDSVEITAAKQRSSAEDEINVLDLLLVLAKHWKKIVLVPFVIAVLTAAYSLSMPNIYTATAMILPSEDDKGLMAQMGGLASLALGATTASSSKAELLVTMLKSETVMAPIVDRFKLMEVYQVQYRARAYAALGSNSDVNVGKKDGMVTIAVDNKDPKLAADIANAYVDELGKVAARFYMTGAGTNRAFLEERLSKAKADLVSAEETLKDFQRRNKSVGVPDQAKATLDVVARIRTQLAAQEIQLETLQQQFTNESQEVKAAKAAVASSRRQIAGLEGGSAGAIPGIGVVPQLGQEYVRLMREFKVQEGLVELLVKQYEVSKLNEVKDVAPFHVFQRASVPELKSKPRRGVIVILTAFASLLAMVALAFLIEYCSNMKDENRMRWQQLRRILPLPPRCNQ